MIQPLDEWFIDDHFELKDTREPIAAASHEADIQQQQPDHSRGAAQGEVSEDDGSTILLGALWDTEWDVFGQDDNDQAGRCALKPTSGDGYDSQLGSFGTSFGHQGSNVQPPVDHSCFLEVGSKYPGEYKRRRSTAVGSANKSSSGERIKRRPPEDRLTQILISSTDGVSDQRLGHQGESNQSFSMYDAILALLTDLLQSKGQDIDIDDRTSTLIRELSEYLARLEITGMRLTQNDLSGQAIVAIGLDCREIVLASLTPSELMSSIADMAAHLLHMVLRMLSFRSGVALSGRGMEVDNWFGVCLSS
ncbi:MAG: hypothetical protein M1835_007514 [Candelina submexicana]|nr:MAG: hypothetical protein M1835_007514 [Candelina submexicana]